MKYELTEETIKYFGRTLHRIKAVKDFGTIRSGEVGGFVENEKNLSQEGHAWVYDNALVYGDARVCGDAWVCGDAQVSGDALVYGDARVENSSDYAVFKNTWSSLRWFTYTSSNKMWAVGCFYGTGEELIVKAYEDGELKGKCYEAIVRATEAIEAAKAKAKEANDANA